MKVGTKSLLFGVHQLVWHPLTVCWAWKELYGRPSWKETVCIIIHDWGYFGKPNMDGPEGERHVELGANLAGLLFGDEYRRLCLYHSRHYARQYCAEPSRLCWADKLSIKYEASWWYLFRARLSGELKEYRNMADAADLAPAFTSDRGWFICITNKFITLSEQQRADAVPYANQSARR